MSFHRSLMIGRLGRTWNPGRKRRLVPVTSTVLDCMGGIDIVFHGDSRRQYTNPSRLLLRREVRYPGIAWRCFTTSNNNNKPQDDQEKKETSEDVKSQRFWAHWIRELQSPPNVVTITRILCTPILSYWIVTGQHKLALGGCVLAAASDWLDGYLAKNHGMGTVLGAYLDPMADKIFINVLSVSLWYTGILPGPLVALWLARDVLLIGGAAAFVRSQSKDGFHAFDPTATPLRVNPTNLSKANTGLQFLTLGVGIVYPLSSSIPTEVLSGLCYLTGFTTVASGLSYLDYSAFSDSGNQLEKDKSKEEEK